jgi:hypothetical protein
MPSQNISLHLGQSLQLTFIFLLLTSIKETPRSKLSLPHLGHRVFIIPQLDVLHVNHLLFFSKQTVSCAISNDKKSKLTEVKQ